MSSKRVLRPIAVVIVAAIAAAVNPGPAHAAPDVAVTVVDLHLVDGEQPSFMAGQPFYLNPTVSIPPGLQVRFFSAAKDGLLQRPHRTSADRRCWIYDSSVWKPAASDGQLRFGNIPAEWAAGPGVNGQVYFLVFEDGDLPDGPIQILKDQVPIYFNSGLQISIHPSPDADRRPRRGVGAGAPGAVAPGAVGPGALAWVGGTAAAATGGEAPPPLICLEVAAIQKGAVRFAAASNCGGAGSGQPSAALSPWQRLAQGWLALLGRGPAVALAR
jgi:hypothetical protein